MNQLFNGTAGMARTISKSVGRTGINQFADAKTVQELINANLGKLVPLAPLAIDGRVGPKTIFAIEEFQRRVVQMQLPDGRVDPGGRTLSALNGGVPAGMAPTTPAPTLNEWSGDSAQWSQDKKLKSLNGQFRPKVEKVLSTLKAAGFQPKIFYGWRSVAVQAELFKAGRSKVTFSFHNAQTKDGVPNAFAADIIDSRWGWSAAAEQNGFWKALGAAAKAEGLVWGGDWVSFRDWAHIQYHQNSALGQVKNDSGL